MKRTDRLLGMRQNISRRDILHGIGGVATAAFVPGVAFADQVLATEEAAAHYYPPSLSGMRGSHAGSFEVAHQLAREGKRDWGQLSEPDADVYDLVVVGAGLSGLAAAHYYRKSNPDARVLIIDNHDDFGGHAKRNEYEVSGRNIVGYGGSQSLEAPASYAASTKTLLKDIGVDVDRFHSAYDQSFFRRNGLTGAVFFDKQNWSVDKVVKYDLGSLRFTLPLADSPDAVEDAVAKMPMSAAARKEMLHILTSKADVFGDLSEYERYEILGSISYRDYLRDYLGVTEAEVFAAMQSLVTDLGADAAAVTAAGAIDYLALPGTDASGLTDDEDEEPYIFHFPDGNASIARLLVRKMIPEVAPGSTMDDIVLAAFDYSKLDVADSATRIRLNSTVVNVEHDGDPKTSRKVSVDYVCGGAQSRVYAKSCIMACYNAIIPSICTELPQAQRDALRLNVKTPILYTNVALNNWRAWHKMGVGAISAPSSYHVNAMLDFPVNMGGYEFASSPDDPIVVHMERFPHKANAGLTKREQSRLGRHELLSTSFDTIERSIREQLDAMLADGGFDAARDIAGITVNRWSHGYAGRDWLEDDWYRDPNDKRYWFVQGRQAFGRIRIANSDAGASATVDSAMKEAYRAVGELDHS